MLGNVQKNEIILKIISSLTVILRCYEITLFLRCYEITLFFFCFFFKKWEDLSFEFFFPLHSLFSSQSSEILWLSIPPKHTFIICQLALNFLLFMYSPSTMYKLILFQLSAFKVLLKKVR